MDKLPQEQAIVVTIDGPGGSGKGTISRLLAKHLDWHLLESGALYRLLALEADKHHVPLDDIAALTSLAETLDVQFIPDPKQEHTQFILEGEDVSNEIIQESCGDKASQISVYLSVRQALLAKQRSFRQMPGLVAEGRDMGTVVFPDAALKIFLSASDTERAQRRYNQLKAQGIHVSLDALQNELKARDERDRQRVVSPLQPAVDAIIVDTTGMDVQSVFTRILQLFDEHFNINRP
ncbi:MAG: (d)CMP kinase [Gammaproteobacteria bacterium]|jgi:cytidylate kinase